MNQRIAHIALVVKNYDEAIEFYTKKMLFDLIEDTDLGEGKRWVLVKPKGDSNCCLLLAEPVNKRQAKSIGNQTGGRVFLFLYTDNFERDYQNLLKKNIEIIRPPVVETFGTVAVFSDLYGNWWDLIEPSETNLL